MKLTISIFSERWYWCDWTSRTFDALHPWKASAIAEIENEGPGFAVKGKDIMAGACTVTTYKARRDNQVHEVILDGWQADGVAATRIMTFGQLTLFKIRTDYEDIYPEPYREAEREAEKEEAAKNKRRTKV